MAIAGLMCALFACGDDSGTNGTVCGEAGTVGITQTCVCLGASGGVQTCQADGTWSACDCGQTDAGTADTATADSNAVDTTADPDTSTDPDTGTSDTGTSDTGTPDTVATDATADPDTDTSDTSTTEIGTPDTAADPDTTADPDRCSDSAVGADTSTEPGTDTSTEPGTDTSTEPGTDTSTEPGTDTSTEPGTDTSTEPGTDTPPEGFVLLSAGTFMMGSPISEPDHWHSETQHEVTLTRDFYMQTHEVTQGAYQALMDTNPSHFSSCGADCPVEMITWTEAIAYANALSEAEGLAPCYDADGALATVVTPYDCEGYRLPTEAEWEYAARAGTTTAWYCGDDDLCLDSIAWYYDNSGDTTHPVGQKTPNAWGLYDMTGNVWEWVWDSYTDYPSSVQTDPAGSDSCTNLVFRGGSWAVPGKFQRSAARGGASAGMRHREIGFRLARTAP